MRDRAEAGISFIDDEGSVVALDESATELLWRELDGLDAATVSACPTCRSRVVACVAVVDLLSARGNEEWILDLVELAEDAPTLHLYVVDQRIRCAHRAWRDPGYEEWFDAIDDRPRARRV
jgi:hypothetical protein